MKSIKAFLAILLFSSSILFYNCTPSQDFLPTKQEVITNGKWQVSNFSTDVNLTNQFQNLQLTFNNNGTITIDDGSEVITGLWNIKNETFLQIHIKTHNESLLQLNGDWNIFEFTNRKASFQKQTVQTQMQITKI